MSAARTTYETLLVELDRGVALVTLNRPERLNAFNRQMTDDLLDALGAFEADEAVRAVVVTGAGRTRKEELEAFAWLAARPDAAEGLAAFREERGPEWPAIAEELPL